MISAGSAQINSVTARDVPLRKAAPNARTLPMSIKEPAFPVEISVWAARNVQIKISVLSASLMLITCKTQSVFSATIR